MGPPLRCVPQCTIDFADKNLDVLGSSGSEFDVLLTIPEWSESDQPTYYEGFESPGPFELHNGAHFTESMVMFCYCCHTLAMSNDVVEKIPYQ